MERSPLIECAPALQLCIGLSQWSQLGRVAVNCRAEPCLLAAWIKRKHRAEEENRECTSGQGRGDSNSHLCFPVEAAWEERLQGPAQGLGRISNGRTGLPRHAHSVFGEVADHPGVFYWCSALRVKHERALHFLFTVMLLQLVLPFKLDPKG